ncbi:hypothetical protein QLX67_12565, partial [Balneolaceae bacterium ANBcel3]|nr:hypothetical protein [Balneolaceae bacterium ANBcel3]
MICISDIEKNHRHEKKEPGSYEWWYFDGISEDEQYKLVIIFYDGCPFSTRYIRELDSGAHTSMKLPGRYPGISISVYYRDEPIFYSMSHYPPEACSFSDIGTDIRVGENSLKISGRERHNVSEYMGCDIRINERLPSGDELKGIITFTGMKTHPELMQQGPPTEKEEPSTKASHCWNLVMPRADLQCRMNLIQNGLIKKELKFEGTGYHDHNVGHEP